MTLKSVALAALLALSPASALAQTIRCTTIFSTTTCNGDDGTRITGTTTFDTTTWRVEPGIRPAPEPSWLTPSDTYRCTSIFDTTTCTAR